MPDEGLKAEFGREAHSTQEASQENLVIKRQLDPGPDKESGGSFIHLSGNIAIAHKLDYNFYAQLFIMVVLMFFKNDFCPCKSIMECKFPQTVFVLTQPDGWEYKMRVMCIFF